MNQPDADRPTKPEYSFNSTQELSEWIKESTHILSSAACMLLPGRPTENSGLSSSGYTLFVDPSSSVLASVAQIARRTEAKSDQSWVSVAVDRALQSNAELTSLIMVSVGDYVYSLARLYVRAPEPNCPPPHEVRVRLIEMANQSSAFDGEFGERAGQLITVYERELIKGVDRLWEEESQREGGSNTFELFDKAYKFITDQMSLHYRLVVDLIRLYDPSMNILGYTAEQLKAYQQ